MTIFRDKYTLELIMIEQKIKEIMTRLQKRKEENIIWVRIHGHILVYLELLLFAMIKATIFIIMIVFVIKHQIKK